MPADLRTILCVEDDPDIREIIQMSLELAGDFVVESYGSGEEALRRAAVLLPDLILLDVMMPGYDGPELLAALRRNPATATIPVIFMTAKVQRSDVQHLKALGAAGVIAKPFDPMTLAQEIKSIWQVQHG